MKWVRSLVLILNVLFIFQASTWAQTAAKGPEVETITPKSDETYWTPKRMREAKPMPLPSIPDGRHYRKRPKTTAITPKSDETYWTPKRMREAKPMPLPSIPDNDKRPD